MNLEIYQLNTESEEATKLLFMNADQFQRRNVPIHSDLYNMVYTGPVLVGETLDDIYTRFNIAHPIGFRGHSLSVSDVIVLEDDNARRAYFVDSIGFSPVPDFFKQPERSQEKPKEPDVAVAVGYNFALVPQSEVKDLALHEVGTVRVKGKNMPLMKADTFEESTKLDALLDKYGEREIKDYTISPVIMRGELELTIPGFDMDKDDLSFGSYYFFCKGKEIPVDFSGIGWDIEQEGDHLLVSFDTDYTGLATDVFLDDYFEPNYVSLGLRLGDITAEYLAGTHAISDFRVLAEVNGNEMDPADIAKTGKFAIKSLSFDNGTKEYPVRPEVLEEFNQHLQFEANKKAPLMDQIQGAEAKKGTPPNSYNNKNMETER